MATWQEFETSSPEMAAEGKRLIYQFGTGLGFLATIRKDGGPRLHPICPIVWDGGLFAFMVPSPKRGDLRRDGRYALHSYPPEEVDDEFYLSGAVREVSDPDTIAGVTAACQHPVQPEDVLFVFNIERGLLATYRHRGDWPPTYTKWAAPEQTQGNAGVD